MVASIPVILAVGTALGFLSGMGVGGGSLLMLWLTLVLDMPHTQARFLNLLCFIPCAVVVSLFRYKQGKLDLKRILPAIAAGCVSAGLFAWLSSRLDTQLLKNFFGALLLITGVRELLYKPKKQ